MQKERKERRKMMRRKEDKKRAGMVRTIVIDMALDEFVCSFIQRKRDGISIFKTVAMSKIV
jgi:hypothetical protein